MRFLSQARLYTTVHGFSLPSRSRHIVVSQRPVAGFEFDLKSWMAIFDLGCVHETAAYMNKPCPSSVVYFRFFLHIFFSIRH